ncbi:MAG TPA: OB-fold domain-containing protein [Rubrivivax sp.]|nr:OB-fold domain-containing protein [Rubrivivax sp.]HPO19416.1 OB-fold domain-containing protein [Rubrivivax sp.]
MSETRHAPTRPLPEMSGLSGEFYGWCNQGELRFQRCTHCERWRHVPREICAHCGSFEWSWQRSSGHGRVFSWTEVVRALHPAFGNATPYAPVIVEMDEGVRVLTRVLDCAADQLRMDMPVAVEFVAASDAVRLPYFRRRDA